MNHRESLSLSPVIVACTPDRTPLPSLAPLRPASRPYPSGGHFRQKSRLSTFCRCPPNDVVFGRRSMPPKTSRDRITIDSALGRSSVASGGIPLPPCLIACSPSGYQSPSHSTHAAARPRTNALTLDSSPRERFSGFLFGRRLLARALPLSHCGATPVPSLAAGFVLPAVALAPPRTHATRRTGKFAPTADLRRNWQHTLARRPKKSPYGL